MIIINIWIIVSTVCINSCTTLQLSIWKKDVKSVQRTYENLPLLSFEIEVRLDIDEKVKMSKRKIISDKDVVEEVLQFGEDSDKNLEGKDDLEEHFLENQVHFQLQPGKTKL